MSTDRKRLRGLGVRRGADPGWQAAGQVPRAVDPDQAIADRLEQVAAPEDGVGQGADAGSDVEVHVEALVAQAEIDFGPLEDQPPDAVTALGEVEADDPPVRQGAAAERIGATGQAVGVDVNEEMLAVAGRIAPAISWRQARAESLPFEDDSVDAVVSQFGLMFFEDRAAALREMARVLRPGGRLAVAVWDRLESSPGYRAMVELLSRQFGEETASGLRAPFVLGDRQALVGLFEEAGITGAEVRTEPGVARFPSLEAWIYTDVRGWTLSDAIDDAGLERLQHEARTALRQFVSSDGAVEFAVSAHIVTASAS